MPPARHTPPSESALPDIDPAAYGLRGSREGVQQLVGDIQTQLLQDIRQEVLQDIRLEML